MKRIRLRAPTLKLQRQRAEAKDKKKIKEQSTKKKLVTHH